MIPLLDIQGQMRALTVDDEGIRLAPQILSDAIRTQFVQASYTRRAIRRPARPGGLNQVGAAGIVSWAERIGADTVTQWSHRLLDYSERLMREAVSKLSDGVYDYVDYLDDDGGDAENIPLRSDDRLGH